ncbi:MAG: hypothetical protein NTZ74_11220 [Chloroflexi bacterium]|nr:hypothetical protein [Chloroflexota bacterium]
MKRVTHLLLLSGFLLFGINAPAVAQTPVVAEFRLNINRDFGYGAGADIRGLFSLSVVGPAGFTAVTYLMDGKGVAVLTQSPFKFQFNTSQYAFGWHDLSAEVTTSGGEVIQTPVRRLNFVSSAEETSGMKKILFPMLSLIGGIFLVMILAQWIVTKRQNPHGISPGFQRNYGLFGGSICKKCGRPTPRHLWGLNMVVGKLDRCENCGQWSLMRVQPLEVLRAAEKAEQQSEDSKTRAVGRTEEDKLRDLIEKSKYE